MHFGYLLLTFHKPYVSPQNRFYLTRLTSGYESWKGERGSTLPRIYNFQEPQAASGAVCSGNQYLIPILRINFPPFSTKSAHPSVNLPKAGKCKLSLSLWYTILFRQVAPTGHLI